MRVVVNDSFAGPTPKSVIVENDNGITIAALYIEKDGTLHADSWIADGRGAPTPEPEMV